MTEPTDHEKLASLFERWYVAQGAEADAIWKEIEELQARMSQDTMNVFASIGIRVKP